MCKLNFETTVQNNQMLVSEVWKTTFLKLPLFAKTNEITFFQFSNR
jgi:hypothetical protein